MTPEQHTLQELCEDLFEIRVSFLKDFGREVDQEMIDNIPQMVRLVNEQHILALGLDPKIDIKFRIQVAKNESLTSPIGKGLYYSALDGDTSDIRLS